MISQLTANIKVTKNLANGYMTLDNGGFFVYDKDTHSIISDVVQCRDGFSGVFKENHERVGFCCNNLNIESLDDFFNKLEEKLKLEPRTLFVRTNQKNTVIVRMNPFWRQTHFHRNMFSLFLRCGAVFYKGDFELALNTYTLTQRIKFAVDYFLNGYTKPINSNLLMYGVVACFQPHALNPNILNTFLEKP